MTVLPPGSLYAIVDPTRIAGGMSSSRADAVGRFVRAVVDGGADVVQLRDKEATARKTHYLASHLAELCKQLDVPFIVNDRVDIALTSGADGVHVGPEDVPVEAVRKVVDDDFVVGGSAGIPEVARRLEDQGADYLGVGAIYEARESKPDASPPRGPEALGAVCEAVDIPVVGIGGIGPSNARAVVEQGAAGVAVISALTKGKDPAEAAGRLSEAVRSG